MTVIEQIQEKYPFLTRKQREVADYMLEDPERMSYATLREISQDLSITEMTILKTCNLLGFASFSTLKYEFRKYAAQQLDLLRHPGVEFSTPAAPEYELGDLRRLLSEIRNEEAALFSAFIHNLSLDDVFQAAGMILAADQVILCGRGVSATICDYFATLLTLLGRGVVNVNTELDNAIYAALPLLTGNTLLIAVSYPDYYRMTAKLVEYARRREVKILGLTDSKRSPIVPNCDLVLTSPTRTRMLPNTIGAPMSMITLVASAINIQLSAQGCQGAECSEDFFSLFDGGSVDSGSQQAECD